MLRSREGQCGIEAIEIKEHSTGGGQATIQKGHEAIEIKEHSRGKEKRHAQQFPAGYKKTTHRALSDVHTPDL